MEYISNSFSSLTNYIWSYFYSYDQNQQLQSNIDPQQATIKLRALIAEIYYTIDIKIKRYQTDLTEVKEKFSQFIHSENYQEKERLEYCRIITKIQNDIDILTAIQNEIKKFYKKEESFIIIRNDQEKLKDTFLPTIHNLLFACNYEDSLQIKLYKFNEFLTYLYGQEYKLDLDNNLIDQSFRDTLTKIYTDEDFENTCLIFSKQSLINLENIYRLNEEKSKLYTNNNNQSQPQPIS